jgi:hypothetical protein
MPATGPAAARSDLAGGTDVAADKETAGKEPVSKVTVEKGRNGHYYFALTHYGVTYPLNGPFPNALQAALAGQAALKSLDAQTGGRKS